MNLDTQIDVIGGFKRAFQATKDLVGKTLARKPKSPSTDELLSNYHSYETYKEITRDPTLSPVITGQLQDPYSISGSIPCPYSSISLSGNAPKVPLPWFLEGVPEQYHKHYTEWQAKQAKNAPQDFGTYLFATGLFAPGQQHPNINVCSTGWDYPYLS